MDPAEVGWLSIRNGTSGGCARTTDAVQLTSTHAAREYVREKQRCTDMTYPLNRCRGIRNVTYQSNAEAVCEPNSNAQCGFVDDFTRPLQILAPLLLRRPSQRQTHPAARNTPPPRIGLRRFQSETGLSTLLASMAICGTLEVRSSSPLDRIATRLTPSASSSQHLLTNGIIVQRDPRRMTSPEGVFTPALRLYFRIQDGPQLTQDPLLPLVLARPGLARVGYHAHHQHHVRWLHDASCQTRGPFASSIWRRSGRCIRSDLYHTRAERCIGIRPDARIRRSIQA